MSKTDVYRDGKVHVQKRMCSTCIFRPGNLMHLQEGRVEQMVEEATRDGGCIPCHKNLDNEGQAICNGFFTKHQTDSLQIAERLGIVEYVSLPDA